MDWFVKMARLPGKGPVTVGLLLNRMAIMRKTKVLEFSGRGVTRELAINRKTLYTALTALESIGFLTQHKKGRGSYTIVELLTKP